MYSIRNIFILNDHLLLYLILVQYFTITINIRKRKVYLKLDIKNSVIGNFVLNILVMKDSGGVITS